MGHIDWSQVCPTQDEIREHFSNQDIQQIIYNENYPRVIVRVDGGWWAWDRWHGGGFWHRTY